MKTVLVAATAALGLLASTAAAEPVKLGDAQLTGVTAGFLGWSRGGEDGQTAFAVIQQIAINVGDVYGTSPGNGDNGNDLVGVNNSGPPMVVGAYNNANIWQELLGGGPGGPPFSP